MKIFKYVVCLFKGHMWRWEWRDSKGNLLEHDSCMRCGKRGRYAMGKDYVEDYASFKDRRQSWSI